MTSVLNAEQIAQYQRDGYLVIEDYFTRDEMDLLLEITRADREFVDGAVKKQDREGRTSLLSIRHELPRDIYGAISRSKRVVEPLEQLVGSEIYHYHHKMMLKEPLVGGAWDWHQDFGYWYSSFLYPDMASCMIAVDRATRENGCLQVLKGSHRMGRLDHAKSGTQTGAELERVEAAVDQMELVYCELEPGSVLFFHCNLLHRSDPNESEDPRWSLICCYSAAHNRPISPDVAGQYEKLETLDGGQIREIALEHRKQVLGSLA
jgi:ectoine hydroxylase